MQGKFERTDRLPRAEPLGIFVIDLVANEPAEKPFKGKVAFVTGTRDIGGGIALALALRGASVVGIHRDQQKEKRSKPIIDAIQKYTDAPSEFLVGDITKPEDRTKARETIEQSFNGQLDFLVLSASGPTTEVNVDANNALITEFLPLMREGGTVVLMQSVPGHIAHKLEGLDLIPEFYVPVAQAKHAGEQTIRAREAELKAKGVSLLVICPTVVPDTTNMELFRKYDPTIDAKHDALSDMLGLPHTVPISDVATKLADDLEAKKPSGFTELFADVEDAYGRLGEVYGENAIRVDTVDVNGVGRAIIGRAELETEGEIPEMRDFRFISVETAEGYFPIQKENTRGHFKEETGLSVLQGHKTPRLAMEVVNRALSEDGRPHQRMVGFEKAKFMLPLVPGVEARVIITVREKNPNPNNPLSNYDQVDVAIYAKNEEKPRITIDGLAYEPDLEDVPHLEPDIHIEAAALTRGVDALRGRSLAEDVPLFEEVGPVFIFDSTKAGDAMEYATIGGGQEGKTITGDVDVHRNGVKIGEVNGIKARITKRKAAARILQAVS